MTDFKAARINMVDSQIHPMGVVNEAILEAFRTVPREDFVPDNRRTVAYSDEDMALAQKGRYLMEPVTHARLVQAAAPTPSDIVLDVGGATGYSAAILAGICREVVATEPDAALLAKAENTWKALGASNVIPHQAPFAQGCTTHGPYTLIFLNGSASEMPVTLLDQLAPHGRALAVIRKEDDRIGRATLFSKNSNGLVSERVLFDAAVPYLPGLEPLKQFVF